MTMLESLRTLGWACALAGALLVGCSASGPEPVREREPVTPLAFGGQTGAGVPPNCRDDAQCALDADRAAQGFRVSEPSSPLVSSACAAPAESSDFAPGEVCACRFACTDEEGTRIGARIGSIGAGTCSHAEAVEHTVDVGVRAGVPSGYVDRFGRDYLADYDFSGCDPAQPSTSCDAVCGELERRWHGEAEGAYDVQLMHTTCNPEVHDCRTVFEVDGECYTHLGANLGSERLQRGPLDCRTCAASDEDVLAREACELPICEGAATFDRIDEIDAGIDCDAL